MDGSFRGRKQCKEVRTAGERQVVLTTSCMNTQYVLIDNCVTDLLAEAGVDPAKDLENTEFCIAYTPDLEQEYRNALCSKTLLPEARKLIEKLLTTGIPIGFFGFSELNKKNKGPWAGFGRGVWADEEQREWIRRETQAHEDGKARERKAHQECEETKDSESDKPRTRTDRHLIALAKHDIVITNGTKEGHWKRLLKGEGRVIQWVEFKEILLKEDNVASAIRRF
jgi:hypothetical protein